jgi:UDP-N-acetylmuramoylalanine--D-glutamate ligase
MVLHENDLAPLLWRGRLVVVTGTRGKTRLVRLLTEALQLAGKDVTGAERADGGLAGVVAARRGGAPDSILVSRMDAGESLALRHLRADAVIWTNLLEEEAARHGSMEAAFAAGWRMFERAVGGDVFAGETVQRWADRLGQTLPPDSRVATDDASGDVLLRHTPFETEPAHETFLLAAAWWRASGLRESILYAAAQGSAAR